jgi:hypothetical protein
MVPVRSFLAAVADHCSSSAWIAAASAVRLSTGADGAQELVRKADVSGASRPGVGADQRPVVLDAVPLHKHLVHDQRISGNAVMKDCATPVIAFRPTAGTSLLTVSEPSLNRRRPGSPHPGCNTRRRNARRNGALDPLAFISPCCHRSAGSRPRMRSSANRPPQPLLRQMQAPR